ncbi:tubby-related protein 3-like protein [Dinothrombium tinctorium]|uniref:Tubby-related protein 3-like protein n=1 Tax=Dinothrombium tinctorium TaxID=1965070 RepID=A0A3S3PG00_9ACAR|nr:tubby-related protein 3-like protein [Dinothrombium tinctorium]
MRFNDENIRSAKSLVHFDKYQEKLLTDEYSKDSIDGISNPSLSSSEDFKDSKEGNLSLSSPVLAPQSKNKSIDSSEQESPIKLVEDVKSATAVAHTPRRENFESDTTSSESNDKASNEEKVEKPPEIKELNPLTTILNNAELLLFVTQPVSPSKTYQCVIVRDKRGIDRSFYPTYYMHLQAIVSNEATSENLEKALVTSSPTINEEDNASSKNRGSTKSASNSSSKRTNRRQIFLLGGRRRKRSKTYLIGNDPFDITRENCIAKLKSNVLGTQFNAIK